YRLNKKADKKDSSTSADSDKTSEIKPDKKDIAYDLVVVNLNNKTSHTISHVLNYAISSDANQLLASQVDNDGTDNQVTLLGLNNDFTS
ncbi:hypothetical protein, partial [Streptomyces acidiscabies]|uniref:hypothetical protein n=1 Tax=Streptomyces acidiscabies TaxID=42234 RepID=UPI0038F7915B